MTLRLTILARIIDDESFYSTLAKATGVRDIKEHLRKNHSDLTKPESQRAIRVHFGIPITELLTK